MKNIKVEDIKKFYLAKDVNKMFVVYLDKENNKYVVENLSLEDGYNKLAEYLKENECELKDLIEDDKYDVVDLNELKDKIKEDFSSEKEDDEDLEKLGDKISKKLDSISNIKIDRLKIKKWIIRTGLVLGGFVVVGGIYKLGKHNGKKDNATSTTEITSEIMNDNSEVNQNTYSSVDDILTNSNINESKKQAVFATWAYINNYNNTVASNHICSDGTRLAHSWDEIISDYLVYNYISGEEAIQIFDNCNIDSTELKANYSSSIEQATMEYVVLTEPTSKEGLIKSDTGKNFYRKYEDMIIRFNKSGDDIQSKEQIAKEFYSEVYLDFLNGNEISENESYKLSVIPIINAFNLLTQDINCDIKLTDENKTKITDMGNGIFVSSYLESISSYVNANSISFNDDITYAEIVDIAIEELCDNNLYNIDEVNRNISNSKEYKSMFKQSTSLDDKSQSNKVRNSSNGYSNYNQSVANTAGEISEEEDTIPDWMIEDNDQENGYDNGQDDEYDPSVNEDIPNIDSDTPDMSFFKSSYQSIDEEEKQNYYEAVANKIIETMASENAPSKSKINIK